MRRNLVGILVFVWVLAALSPAIAQPTITSPPPASGGSPSAALVFTFSEAMEPDLSGVDFVDLTTFATLPTTAVWSGGNKVLTCTPTPAFPANRMIVWSAYGENPSGAALEGTTGGLFTTGSGSGGSGGFGTNAITTFSVGKILHYQQTSAGAPTLDPDTPYGFSGVTALSSNRTATSITLTLPTAGVSNLVQIPQQPEVYVGYGFSMTPGEWDTTFPPGDYSFLVQAAASNQTVVVNLPTTNVMAQPGAPHVTNYLAAQVVDPSQPFVLGWDAFPGGTSAHYIDVDIGTVYGSANPGLPGALTGTARTFTIPAGTLQPNTTYASQIGFFRHTGATNGSYATAAYRATYTEFSLITIGGGQLVLTNLSWVPGVFSFDVLCSVGQTVTVEYTNVLSPGPWPKLLTTNSPGPAFHVDSPASSSPSLFFRARNGP